MLIDLIRKAVCQVVLHQNLFQERTLHIFWEILKRMHTITCAFQKNCRYDFVGCQIHLPLLLSRFEKNTVSTLKAKQLWFAVMNLCCGHTYEMAQKFVIDAADPHSIDQVIIGLRDLFPKLIMLVRHENNFFHFYQNLTGSVLSMAVKHKLNNAAWSNMTKIYLTNGCWWE